MRILLAYDGSSGADVALHDLERAGLPNGCEAVVISVVEQWLPPPPPSSYEIAEATFAECAIDEVAEGSWQPSQAVDDANALAFQAKELVRSWFPTWNVHADVQSGSPARQIIKKAEEWDADLVVVGSEGRSALGRLILGSVSLRVVTDAPCSVRVSRHQAGEKDSRIRIIIAVDGSPGADAAVREVAARAWPPGSEVRLVTSVDPLHMYSMQPEDKFGYMRSVHQSAEKRLRETGLDVVSLIREEDPKQFIVAEAERWGADSIFVGARGLGRIGRFLLGSISTAVVARAPCSVEVIRERRAK